MNKLRNVEFNVKKINEPTITINTDLIKEIQKLFSENWSVALTKIEQQLLKILYYENSALNVYELRRHLIFSTIYHILTKIEELPDLKKYKDYEPNKNISKKIFLFLEDKYSYYPSFEFSNNITNNFFQMLSQLTFLKNVKKDGKKYLKQNVVGRSSLSQYEINDYLKNKTKAEELFYEILRNLQIEIYGFKTISDALDNLVLMKVVLIREIKTGKSKKVYFLNPLIISHIKEENSLTPQKPKEDKRKGVNKK